MPAGSSNPGGLRTSSNMLVCNPEFGCTKNVCGEWWALKNAEIFYSNGGCFDLARYGLKVFMWWDLYKSLFSIVQDITDKPGVLAYIQNDTSYEHIHVTVGDISAAINELPNDKSPGNDGLMSEHVKMNFIACVLQAPVMLRVETRGPEMKRKVTNKSKQKVHKLLGLTLYHNELFYHDMQISWQNSCSPPMRLPDSYLIQCQNHV